MAFESTIRENESLLLEETRQLIKSCLNEDRHAQRMLYELYAPRMFGICLRYAKNREEAEDIMQEGFLQVFKSLQNFKFSGSFEGWIRKIMVYSAIAKYRGKSKLHSVLTIENENIIAYENEDILSRLGKKELLQMVQDLPPAYRMVFNLYVFEGLKHREIAEQLDISEGTSKSNLHDAKLILQRAVMNSMKIANQKSTNG
ncbi:MAG TPA: sigma-70 family RNA polymerase sigma factor [Hanamia sp.]|nr:sigma-70 family RNA polymerase sigma factor [Hanamia sp.]